MRTIVAVAGIILIVPTAGLDAGFKRVIEVVVASDANPVISVEATATATRNVNDV
jgi:hypothetical protein